MNKFIIIFIIILFITLFTGCPENNTEKTVTSTTYDIIVTAYPNPTQTVQADENGDYANFTLSINTSDSNSLYWVECVPVDGGAHYNNGKYNLTNTATNILVGACFTSADTVTQWQARIRKNSTTPGSEILYTENINYTVTWE